MPKTEKVEWITRAECARRLSVSASIISRYSKLGLPTRADKKVEWPAAKVWKEENIGSELSGSFYSRQHAAETTRATDSGNVKHTARLAALREIVEPAEQLRFAQVAMRLGCTASQAIALGMWYGEQPGLRLSGITLDELNELAEPETSDWETAVRQKLDMAEIEKQYDAATLPELSGALNEFDIGRQGLPPGSVRRRGSAA